jgi:hypothetical protein
MGQTCVTDADCASNACHGTVCGLPWCADGVRDGDETDVDCGGGCPGCGLGSGCQLDSDCASEACDASTFVCAADHCTDHRLDGDETDVDCGGPTCTARCATDKSCNNGADCATGQCVFGVCQ